MAKSGSDTSTRASVVVERMAEAATSLLATLVPDQRRKAVFDFPAENERRRWYYTPTDHGGVRLRELHPSQQQLVHRLVAAGLSEPGYVTAATIIGLENVLDMREGWRVRFARDRDPSSRGRDPLMYYVSIFGKPGGDGPWGWRFGGHHVSLHYTILGGRIASATPSFFGSDPAEVPFVGPGILRPLGGEEDLGRELVHALDAQQRATAILTPIAPPDLVISNRPSVEDGLVPPNNWEIWRGQLDGTSLERSHTLQSRIEEAVGTTPESLEAVRYTSAPKGLPAVSMTRLQKDVLSRLIRQYIDRMPKELAEIEATKLSGANLNDVHFAWAGGIEKGQPHYYRLQGPRLMIEYDNTQGGANHVHSVWRDPEGDFGADLLAQHYAQEH